MANCKTRVCFHVGTEGKIKTGALRREKKLGLLLFLLLLLEEKREVLFNEEKLLSFVASQFVSFLINNM